MAGFVEMIKAKSPTEAIPWKIAMQAIFGAGAEANTAPDKLRAALQRLNKRLIKDGLPPPAEGRFFETERLVGVRLNPLLAWEVSAEVQDLHYDKSVPHHSVNPHILEESQPGE